MTRTRIITKITTIVRVFDEREEPQLDAAFHDDGNSVDVDFDRGFVHEGMWFSDPELAFITDVLPNQQFAV